MADLSPISTRRANVKKLTDRLSPEVVEIVRLDLIQKVGNALRFAAIEKRELEYIMNHSDDWGAW